MSPEVEAAERSLYLAADNLGRLGSSLPVGKRMGVEAIYGQAYQRLVRLGARPPIRRKYRRTA